MDYQNEPMPGLPVIRPLLDVSRMQIELFLKKHRLAWREDRTNRQSQFVRNRIRNIVFPGLARAGFPGATDALVKLSEIMREEAAVISTQTGRLYKKCLDKKNAKSMMADQLGRLAVAEQRRVIRLWLTESLFHGRMIDFHLIEKIRNDQTSAITLDSKNAVRKKSGRLLIEASSDTHNAPELKTVKLNVPGVTKIIDTGLMITISLSKGFKKNRQVIGRYPAEAYISRENGQVPDLTLRSRRAGDRYVPTGMTGSVTVKDLLINQKIQSRDRASIPVSVSGNEVVWVAGYRVARTWAVKSLRAPSWRVVITRL
jgi:tRNA(Ile)-lysidine synthase